MKHYFLREPRPRNSSIQSPNSFYRRLAHYSHMQTGFTLIELVVVMGIVGILLGIAIPNFTEMIIEQRVRSVASDLIGDLVLARTEAIKQQRRVILQAAPGGWKDGWIIYVERIPKSTSAAMGAWQTFHLALNPAFWSLTTEAKSGLSEIAETQVRVLVKFPFQLQDAPLWRL